MSMCIPGNKMALCLSSLIFVGFPVRFHWPVHELSIKSVPECHGKVHGLN